MQARMSFRRKPAQSNDVINFRDGYLAEPVKTQEPLSALKDEITQLRGKLDERDENRVRSATMEKISALEKKVGYNTLDAHEGPHNGKHGSHDHKVRSQHSHGEHRMSCPKTHSRAQVLEKLESLERSMGSTQVSEQLSRLESKLNNPSQHVMDKLNSLESRLVSSGNVMDKLSHIEGRLSEVSPEHVLNKLSALESKLSQPHEDQQFTKALSRLNALHEEMSTSNSLEDVKASVHSKLLELEKRITTPQVTTDDWLQERKRLSKLQSMRSKIANA
jgi:hypothetical protein